MQLKELGLSWSDAWLTIVTAVGIYYSMLLFSRLWGQRQFSTYSTYDLAFIFALGSLVGRVVLIRVSLLNAVLGLFTMFILHALTGWLHHNFPAVHRAIQNPPILLMAGNQLLEDNLKKAHISHLEVYQHLRLSGVGSLDSVVAVILERNGELSVIKDGEPLDLEVFKEVIGREKLPSRQSSG